MEVCVGAIVDSPRVALPLLTASSIYIVSSANVDPLPTALSIYIVASANVDKNSDSLFVQYEWVNDDVNGAPRSLYFVGEVLIN